MMFEVLTLENHLSNTQVSQLYKVSDFLKRHHFAKYKHSFCLCPARKYIKHGGLFTFQPVMPL